MIVGISKTEEKWLDTIATEIVDEVYGNIRSNGTMNEYFRSEAEALASLRLCQAFLKGVIKGRSAVENGQREIEEWVDWAEGVFQPSIDNN